jgi:hypothetical protein
MKRKLVEKPKTRLPRFAQRYFWDIDARQLDVDKHSTYVIERLLEWGDPPTARWLLKNYSRRKIVGVLKKTRALSRMSANFWAVYFDLSRGEIKCLSKRYQNQLGGVWHD